MRNSRFQPGLLVSTALHAGLLLAAVFAISSPHTFDDAQETVPVDVISDSQFTQIMKGDRSAKDLRVAPRVDRVAEDIDHKPKPPLAEAKKDIPTPPPSLKRLPDPGEDDAREPAQPPKRVADAPTPTPPEKPKVAATQPEKAEPDDAEVVKPKPPTRPKLETKEALKPPKPDKPRLRVKPDEVAKLLQQTKPEDAQGEKADKSAKAAKPKSGEETAPKTKFDAASISNLLSREAPQRRASTGREMTHTASLGAPTGSASKMSASMEGRIGQYIKDHYQPCWKSGLSLGGETYAPIVEFHLTRDGKLDGAPSLVNPTSNPVARARAEQALLAVRRCSPMKIPDEFMPYYEEALHEVSIKFTDLD